jgi:fused signal recognition particle receptor
MSFLKNIFKKPEDSKDLNQGLQKTKKGFLEQLSRTIAGKSSVDDSVLDDLEHVLMTADVGLDTTVKIIERIEDRVAKEKYMNTEELNQILKEEIIGLLADHKDTADGGFDHAKEGDLYVLLVVGVNGVGKTTTIGKLANRFQKAGKKVVLGAGDTFRAAAVDQLKIWAERVGCHFYAKGMNTDPAAVAFETVDYAIKNQCDVAIIDTAGRLHTKSHLMQELSKIKRSVGKRMDGAPHDVLLVLDATTGQNAVEQARHFTNATEVTCLALTKLDGTAKGGVAIGISDQFQIPIRYIGVGEGIDQIQLFDKIQFVETLFEN